jgi:glyoxylase-like metal-dependent hydrolase (beta-lactamase superfamily II)
MSETAMHQVDVLVTGYVEATSNGRMRAAATITLLRGEPMILVDTGDAWQRHELLTTLADREIDPHEIQWVINTHGHLDHVGNNNLFPHATFVLDGDIARHGEYWQHDFSAGSLLISGPPGSTPVSVVATPGHTDHCVSVEVTTSEGVIAIVGDLFEYQGDSQDNAWRKWSRDLLRQQASRELMLAKARYIVPGHGAMFPVSST